MRKSILILGPMVMLAAGAAVGCGGAGTGSKDVQVAGVKHDDCARVRPGVGARAKLVVHQSSTVAIVQDGKRSLAYVADADDASVHTVDVATGKEVAIFWVCYDAISFTLLDANTGAEILCFSTKFRLKKLSK